MFVELFLLLLVVVLFILVLFLLLPKLLFHLADFFIERLQNLPSLEFQVLNDFGLRPVDFLHDLPVVRMKILDMFLASVCAIQNDLVFLSPCFLLLN